MEDVTQERGGHQQAQGREDRGGQHAAEHRCGGQRRQRAGAEPVEGQHVAAERDHRCGVRRVAHSIGERHGGRHRMADDDCTLHAELPERVVEQSACTTGESPWAPGRSL